ncbi:maleylacetoacetate isomerase [Chachezhania sediminis]|uniref:maleylacetoacetate isomerase n=1 Tax=Chachezhania sediminis TaxID=2599291 RepID=UPI00131B5CD6|nr:maleylacetoacetate isomerase [Chachezhania sediminis]
MSPDKNAVTLFDFPNSSSSYRLRIALQMAGIDYDTVLVDLPTGQQRAPEHMARNPQGFVPVLDIDGLRLTQSMAILRYLDTTRGLGLLPEDPVERVKVEALADAIAIDIHPVCNLQVVKYATEISGDAEMRGKWSRHFMRPGMVAFEKMLQGFEGGPFCCGDLPMLPDICLMPQINNCRRWGVELDDLTKTMQAVAACEGVAAFQAAHPDNCPKPG